MHSLPNEQKSVVADKLYQTLRVGGRLDMLTWRCASQQGVHRLSEDVCKLRDRTQKWLQKACFSYQSHVLATASSKQCWDWLQLWIGDSGLSIRPEEADYLFREPRTIYM